MRSLVYDFGQLNTETESDYVKQIVFDHVCEMHTMACDLLCHLHSIDNFVQIQNHSKLSRFIQSIQQPITQVLARSQLYMKERKVYYNLKSNSANLCIAIFHQPEE